MYEELNRNRKEDENMKSNGRISETMMTNDDMKAQKFSEIQQKHWIDALQCVAAAGRIIVPPLQSISPKFTVQKFGERTDNIRDLRSCGNTNGYPTPQW